MKVKAVIAVLMLVLCQTLFPAALTKTGTGLVYGDDFNDGVLNSQMWSKFSDDVGITEEEKGGEIVISGMPGGICASGCINGFVGISSGVWVREHPVRHDAVMAGRMRVLSATDTAIDGHVNLIQFHYCNISPDINISIGIKNNRTGYMDQIDSPRLDGHHVTGEFLRNGFGLFISYNDGMAKKFLFEGDSVVQLGDATAVHLDDNKRMELKALGLQVGKEYLDYRYDWAAVYNQPLDYPVIVQVTGQAVPAGLQVRIDYGNGNSIQAPLSAGRAELPLKENVLYPVPATISVLDDGGNVLGSESIAYDNQLQGLFPGDTFTVDLSALIEENTNVLVSNRILFSVNPNPVQETALFRIHLIKEMPVNLSIYDSRGRLVKSLSENSILGIGLHRITWGGKNINGVKAPAGIYFARLQLAGRINHLKFLLIR